MKRSLPIPARILIGVLWVATLVAAFYAPVYARQMKYHPRTMAGYAPGVIVAPNLDELIVATPAPATAHFDQPQTLSLAGVALVDMAHNNDMELTDLAQLLGRVSARGARVAAVERAEAFLGQLQDAQALIVVVPQTAYSDEELAALRQFVLRGGKLLLIAEPTKAQQFYQARSEANLVEVILSDARHLNSIAGLFGAFFADDYLYSLEKNDGHFQRPIFSHFEAGALTEGLSAVSFQIAHSVLGSAEPLMWGDETTLSSSRPAAERLSPVGLAENGKVLLLGDLSCLSEPALSRYDNDRFVSNVADFLATSSRPADLHAFPSFLGAQVSLIALQPDRADLSSEVISAAGMLQRLLTQQGRSLTMRGEIPADADAIVLGRYEQAGESEARGFLERHGVVLSVSESVTSLLRQVDQSPLTAGQGGSSSLNRAWIADYLNRYGGTQGAIELEGAGSIGMAYTGLFILDSQEGRNTLLILASSDDGLIEMIGRLSVGQLDDCFAQGDVTLCASYEAASAGFAPAPTPELPETPATPTPAATAAPAK